MIMFSLMFLLLAGATAVDGSGCLLKNTQVFGNDIDYHGIGNVASLEKCQDLCFKNVNCLSLTYFLSKLCYLKTTEHGSRKEEKVGVTSWIKNCIEECTCTDINSDEWTATDIKYDVKNGKITPMKPTAVGKKTITNSGSATQSLSLEVSEEFSETMSFSHSAGVSVTVGATFKIGVPLVAEAEISTEISTSYDFSYGTDKTATKTISAKFMCSGPPKKNTICKALLIKDKVTVPYTMTWTKNRDQACKCEEKGTFTEVAANNLLLGIEETDLKLKRVRRSTGEEVKISGGFENYKPS